MYQALRVDVGMSAGCRDGNPEVLEIMNDKEVFRIFEGDDGVVKRVAVAQGEDEK
jgi:hypothetical protein